MLNNGYRALWAEVVSVNKDFRVNSQSFTLTTANTQALPADYQETRYVVLNPGTDQQVYLGRFAAKSGGQMFTRTFRLQGTNLVIEPLHRAAGPYAHLYVPQPPTLTGAVDFDPELDQWRMYAIYHAVIQALSRDELNTSGFDRLLYGIPGTANKGMQGQVKQWAASQRSADPIQIENVRSYRPWQWPAP